DPASKLPIIRYEQGTSRFVGTEGSLEARMLDDFWFNGRIDYVRAELVDVSQNLPRIPPLRGTVGLDWRHNAFSIRPELVIVNHQKRVFDHETPTAGYGIVNVNGSYTFVTKHVSHVISISGGNLTNRLYRDHLSFIKEIAPEIGRAVRIAYLIQF